MKTVIKMSWGQYNVYQHMHRKIGITRPATVLKRFKRRNHARKFAKR